MAGRVVYFSGEFVSEREARVSIFDCALMYGDMAFEMTRTFLGEPFRLDEHLDRLYASLRLLEIDCGLSIEELREQTLVTLEKNRSTEVEGMEWWIMHDVSRGPLPVYGSLWPEGIGPTVTISTWPLITHMGPFAETYKRGVDIVVPAQQALPAHLLDAKAKTRSRLHYKLAELQGQRIGAGAWPLMLDPDVLLMDEPLGALDPMIRADLQKQLRDIFRSLGKTVVMVTHDLAEARYFGGEIVLLRDGREVQRGPFQALVDSPAEPFVGDFVRAQQMGREDAGA